MVRAVHSVLTTAASGLVLGLVAIAVSACGSSSEATDDPQPSINTLASTTINPSTSTTLVTTSNLPPEQFTEADAQAAFLDAWDAYASFIHDRSNAAEVEDRFHGVAKEELLAFGNQLDSEQVLVEVSEGSLEPEVRSVRLGGENQADIEFCEIAVSVKRHRESGEVVAEATESLLTKVELVLNKGWWRIESVSGLGTWPHDQGCPE